MSFVNLIHVRVAGEEGNSTEELSPSDRPGKAQTIVGSAILGQVVQVEKESRLS